MGRKTKEQIQFEWHKDIENGDVVTLKQYPRVEGIYRGRDTTCGAQYAIISFTWANHGVSVNINELCKQYRK